MEADMKKIFAVLCCFGLLAIAGCGDDNADPVGFSKNYVAKKLGCAANCDLSNLDYKVIDNDGELAIVEITGKIAYSEKLYLSMEDGKWAIAPIKPAKTEKTAAKKEEHAPAKKEEHAPAKDAHAKPENAGSHH
jgi:hypothetical protein